MMDSNYNSFYNHMYNSQASLHNTYPATANYNWPYTGNQQYYHHHSNHPLIQPAASQGNENHLDYYSSHLPNYHREQQFNEIFFNNNKKMSDRYLHEQQRQYHDGIMRHDNHVDMHNNGKIVHQQQQQQEWNQYYNEKQSNYVDQQQILQCRVPSSTAVSPVLPASSNNYGVHHHDDNSVQSNSLITANEHDQKEIFGENMRQQNDSDAPFLRALLTNTGKVEYQPDYSKVSTPLSSTGTAESPQQDWSTCSGKWHPSN